MKNLSRFLPRILLAVFFALAAAPDLHAEKRIGVIMTGDVSYYGAIHETFVSELSQRIAGNEKIEFILQKPFPNPISWSNAARKLIAFDVDLIVTYGAPATLAVIHEKSRIPVLFAGYYEPEQTVAADGNVTGCGFKIPMSSIMRYFKQLKAVKTLGIVFSSVEEDSVRQFETVRSLAAQQNIMAVKIDIRSREDLDMLKPMKPDAVLITGSSLVHLWLADILAILQKEQIPAADIFPYDSDSGMLMTLFHPPRSQGQLAAEMAARILRGEKAANLSPQTLRDTELVFNLVEARQLGITFPIHLLIEATRVVQ
ncbi:ABC transporter substrate-binding protein [Thiovibrio sp. JS02]